MSAATVLSTFLAGRPPRTVRAYQAALAHFTRWIAAPNPAAAIEQLLAFGEGAGRVVAIRYRDSSLRAGAAPRTVALHLAVLRSVVRTARDLRAVAWSLAVAGPVAPPPPADAVLDDAAFRRVLRAAVPRSGVRPAHRRDAALLRLLRRLGREEAVNLDLEHVDLVSGVVHVELRGSRRRTAIPVDAATVAALDAWIAARGVESGPLFVSERSGELSRARLHPSGAARIVERVGAAAGMPDLSPDQLRRRRRAAPGVALAG